MRGLALDMDGTLLDSMAFHAEAWTRAFAQFGLTPQPEWFYQWEGINGVEAVARALKALDVEFDGEERARIFQLKRQYFDEMFRPVPSPGLDTLKAVIETLGYPTAVVTGTEGEVAGRALTAIGLRSTLALVLGGDQVVHGKPAPDPYLDAAKLLNLTDCLVLENAPLGIVSAKAAGMPCVAVATTLAPEYLQSADLVLGGLAEFAQWLLDEWQRSDGRGAWVLR